MPFAVIYNTTSLQALSQTSRSWWTSRPLCLRAIAWLDVFRPAQHRQISLRAGLIRS